MVGMAGFEPTTTSPPARCATRLRYIPRGLLYIGLLLGKITALILWFKKNTYFY